MMSWSRDFRTPLSRSMSVCKAVMTFVMEPILKPVCWSGGPELMSEGGRGGEREGGRK